MKKEVKKKKLPVIPLFRRLAWSFKYHLNNIGELHAPTMVKMNTRNQEEEVLKFWADYLKIPHDYGGCVTFGRRKADLYAMFIAGERYPNGIFYLSTASDELLLHSLITLGIPEERIKKIGSLANGEIDYQQLGRELEKN